MAWCYLLVGLDQDSYGMGEIEGKLKEKGNVQYSSFKIKIYWCAVHTLQNHTFPNKKSDCSPFLTFLNFHHLIVALRSAQADEYTALLRPPP